MGKKRGLGLSNEYVFEDLPTDWDADRCGTTAHTQQGHVRTRTGIILPVRLSTILQDANVPIFSVTRPIPNAQWLVVRMRDHRDIHAASVALDRAVGDTADNNQDNGDTGGKSPCA